MQQLYMLVKKLVNTRFRVYFLWLAGTVEKETGVLLEQEYFDIQADRNFKPPSAYQYARLHLVYAVKQDLRKKARLVCDGSRVDPESLNTWETVV